MSIDTRSIVRKKNQHAILNHIINNNGSSRADISKALKLSKPATSDNISDLIDRGIVYEKGISETPVGKKGTMLHFNACNFYILVIDATSCIYYKKINISIFDLSYNEIFTSMINIGNIFNIDLFITELDECLKNIPDIFNKLELIVISVPSIVKDNIQKNIYKKIELPENLKDIFENHFNINCYVYNDINLMAIGEQQFGCAINKENIAYIWIDIAVGGSIILENKLYEGIIGAAGEIGFIPIPILKNNNIEYINLCDMLSINSINLILEKEYMQSEYLSKIKKANNNLGFNDLVNGKKYNDFYCVNLCNKLYLYILNLCKNLIAILDLEAIIISGHFNLLGNDLKLYLENELNEIKHFNTEILISNLENASIYGAKYLGVQKVIKKLILN